MATRRPTASSADGARDGASGAKRLTAPAAMAAVAIAAVIAVAGDGRLVWYSQRSTVTQPRTVESVVRDIGPRRRPALQRRVTELGLPYPPPEVVLVAFKHERELELWARGAKGFVLARRYPILAASGGPGPKLRQGDLQVPEGLYRVVGLNPNSSYHLSLRLDYPNAFDRRMAGRDGRSNLGGDIFIHGRAASIGCLAMGDPAIEEIFLLTAEVGRASVRAVIAPSRRLHDRPAQPAWVPELYRSIESELRRVRGSLDMGA